MKTEWPKVSLGELLSLERRPVKVMPEEQYQEIGIYCFGKGIFHKAPRTGLEVGEKDLYLLKQGDFILQVTFAWEGAVAIVSALENGMYGSTRYPTFRVNETRCVPEFLLHYFKTPDGLNQLVRICPGSAGRNRVLSIKRIPEVMVPLPSVPEQHRIVTQIEALSAQIQYAIKLRDEAGIEVEALWSSSLASSLSNGKREATPIELPQTMQVVRRNVTAPSVPNDIAASWLIPKGWHRVSVGELLLRGMLLDVKDGNHGSNHPRSSEFAENGTSFLMASNIQGGKVLWKEASRLAKETISRLRVGFAEADDVLFTHKASIGRTAIADRDCILSPQVTYYRCNRNYIEPRWLQAFLGSSLFLSQLSEIQGQSTRDFVSIGKQYQQFVLLPPLPEQRRIVSELERLQEQMETLRRLQAETAAELDGLIPSILDKSFCGRL